MKADTEIPSQSQEIGEAIRELKKYITNTPALMSLLYDMDLLPEQCDEGTRDWRNMLILASAWRASQST